MRFSPRGPLENPDYPGPAGAGAPELGGQPRPEIPPFRLSYAYFALAFLFLLFSLNYFHRQIISILMPDISRDLALTDTQVGAITGIGFILFYAASTIPLATLADRGHRRTVISICVIVWSLLTA